MTKNKRANSFDTGIAAEYFVLSQLYRMGVEAYISQGNRKAIDIRVVQNDKSISIDVKAVRGYTSFIVNNVSASKNHYIVFVSYRNRFEEVQTIPEVYIVPSSEVIKLAKPYGKRKIIMTKDIAKYKDNWSLIK